MSDQPIKVTTDAIIFRKVPGSAKRELLLIQRKNPPFQGSWAFPGGFVEEDEDLPTAAARELKEETGLSDVTLRQVGAFGKPGRDPRGPTVTVAYAGWASYNSEVKGADDAARAGWFDLADLPGLAFDHQEILQEALNKNFV